MFRARRKFRLTDIEAFAARSDASRNRSMSIPISVYAKKRRGLFGQSAHIAAAVPLDAVKDFLDDVRQLLKKEKK